MGNGKTWLYGLAAAFIGGGASAVSAGTALMVIDPNDFNLGAGLLKTLKIAGATFLVSGIGHVVAFLKQRPLPTWDGADRRNSGSEKHIG